VALDDVKHRNDVPSVQELLDDVSTNKTASSNYEINVFEHDGGKTRDYLWTVVLELHKSESNDTSIFFWRDALHVTSSIRRD